MARQKVLAVLGTRPEAIKLAPVIGRIKDDPQCFEMLVCGTGQHRTLVDENLDTFDLRIDFDLKIMRQGQSPTDVIAATLVPLDDVLGRVTPDRVLVQGDTSTAMAAALAAFHRRIPVAHVEAGLRTRAITAPFPEEMNRRVISRIADVHFAPTPLNADNLRREGVDPSTVFVTGNPIVDALTQIIAQLSLPLPTCRRSVIITCHRRENLGEPIEQALRAVRGLATRFPDTDFLVFAHPNPGVMRAIACMTPAPNVHICKPLPYREFIQVLRASTLVLTDSGGVQEEAPMFGKPVLILREETERPEAVTVGVARLVGLAEEAIVKAVTDLLSDTDQYMAMARCVQPFGDGRAAERIAGILAGRSVSEFLPEL